MGTRPKLADREPLGHGDEPVEAGAGAPGPGRELGDDRQDSDVGEVGLAWPPPGRRSVAELLRDRRHGPLLQPNQHSGRALPRLTGVGPLVEQRPGVDVSSRGHRPGDQGGIDQHRAEVVLASMHHPASPLALNLEIIQVAAGQGQRAPRGGREAAVGPGAMGDEELVVAAEQVFGLVQLTAGDGQPGRSSPGDDLQVVVVDHLRVSARPPEQVVGSLQLQCREQGDAVRRAGGGEQCIVGPGGRQPGLGAGEGVVHQTGRRENLGRCGVEAGLMDGDAAHAVELCRLVQLVNEGRMHPELVEERPAPSGPAPRHDEEVELAGGHGQLGRSTVGELRPFGVGVALVRPPGDETHRCRLETGCNDQVPQMARLGPRSGGDETLDPGQTVLGEYRGWGVAVSGHQVAGHRGRGHRPVRQHGGGPGVKQPDLVEAETVGGDLADQLVTAGEHVAVLFHHAEVHRRGEGARQPSRRATRARRWRMSSHRDRGRKRRRPPRGRRSDPAGRGDVRAPLATRRGGWRRRRRSR